MAIPPISPVQALQLGVAAQAFGSAAASAFSGLLRSAADLLAPAASGESHATASGIGPKFAHATDLSVLGGQIGELISQIADRVREVVAAGHLSFPTNGVTLSPSPSGDVAVAGGESNADRSALSRVLQQDDALRSLFRALDARRRLFDSAATPTGTSEPLQLHVGTAGASLL